MDGIGTFAGDDGGVNGRADGSIVAAVPAVTALIVTYNHERYIAQALDSVLMQQTSFPFEVIVSEDRSTDRTAEIVRGYAERYPGRVRLMASPVNLRDNEVLLRALRAARGRYVTFLDGDDYWVSPGKLQAQFDFMEAHPDSAITYHDVERVTDDGDVIRVMKGLGHRGTMDDLIQGNFLGTCSVMMRLSALGEVPDWVREMPAGDWPLYLLAARFGFVDHIGGLVSRYRIHGDSFWATRPVAEQALMGLCMQVEFGAHFGPDYAALFADSLRKTVRHILAGILSEPQTVRPVATGSAEQRLQQAETDANAAQIRIFEMSVRIHEAERLRSGAEIRAADAAERLRWAQAEREEARGRADNLAARLSAAEARAAELEARLQRCEAETAEARGQTRQVETVLAETRASLSAAETNAGHLRAALDVSHGHIVRIRRRERRIIAVLGCLVVLLAALALAGLWS